MSSSCCKLVSTMGTRLRMRLLYAGLNPSGSCFLKFYVMILIVIKICPWR